MVPHERQWGDGHARRRDHPVHPPAVVHQRQPLPDPRQRLAQQALHGQRRRRGLLNPQHCCQKPITLSRVAVGPETQRPGHAVTLPAAPASDRATNKIPLGDAVTRLLREVERHNHAGCLVTCYGFRRAKPSLLPDLGRALLGETYRHGEPGARQRLGTFMAEV